MRTEQEMVSLMGKKICSSWLATSNIDRSPPIIATKGTVYIFIAMFAGTTFKSSDNDDQ